MGLRTACGILILFLLSLFGPLPDSWMVAMREISGSDPPEPAFDARSPESISGEDAFRQPKRRPFPERGQILEPDLDARRISFRFAFDPSTGEEVVGDVSESDGESDSRLADGDSHGWVIQDETIGNTK